MYRSIIFLFVFILLSSALFAQNTFTLHFVDSMMYKYLQNSNYDGLIKVGNKAIDENIDSYSIRWRLGYAYLQQSKYRASEHFFRKAVCFNRTSEAMEYLYFSYINLQEFDRAARIYNKFNDELKTKIHSSKLPVIKLLQTNFGTKMPSVKSLRSMTFNSVAVGHRVGVGASMFHQYTGLTQDNYFSSIHQYQYYVSGHMALPYNLKLMPAFSIIKTNVLRPVASPPNTPSVAMLDSTTSQFYGMQIFHESRCFELGMGVTYSNLNADKQQQGVITINYFPFQNNALSIGFSEIFHHSNSGNKTKLLHKINLTAKPISKMELTASYLLVGLSNYNELNGLLINNSIDITTNKLSCLVQYNLYNTAFLFVGYQFENRKHDYNYYNSNTFVTTNYKFNYQIQTISIGTKINLF